MGSMAQAVKDRAKGSSESCKDLGEESGECGKEVIKRWS